MKPGRARGVAALVLLGLGLARPCYSDVSVDPLGIGQAIAGAVNSAANREACLIAALEAAYAESRGLNVMVFNLRQQYDFNPNSDDIKFFKSFDCDGTTFGLWAFCKGTFTNKGDGGYINWAFRGVFTRDPPDSKTVVFDDVCPKATPVSPPPPPVSISCTYTVQPGDTLSNIAAAKGVTLDSIVQANSISNPDEIFAGQILSIQGPSSC